MNKRKRKTNRYYERTKKNLLNLSSEQQTLEQETLTKK